MAFLLGVDTGGTFTDVALIDDTTGALFLLKLSSTPADPSEAIADGIAMILAENEVQPTSVARLSHGTTVATNAVIEGNIARGGLITTKGFRDIIELARQRRPHLFDLDVAKPEPVIPRDRRWEIGERIRADGTVLAAIDRGEVEAVLAGLAQEGVEAIAVCFLHSYLDPSHEREVEAIIRELCPGVSVCASSALVAEFREYERFSSTMLNAVLMPGMSRYLDRLERRVADLGIPTSVRIMQSNGGIMSTRAAGERPIATLFSGPSAGVIGAAHIGQLAGVDDLITFDMGGTSTDVCLVAGGQPVVRNMREINGSPVQSPMLDVHSVGAGGGSIGWIDGGGFLKVGPASAGSRPGPACYGRGGTRPTVTDANVVLGRLSPDALLAGRMALDHDAAARAIQEQVAEPLGLGLVEAAQGIIRVVDANMLRAIRVISVERGKDPRDFTLMAFGGAGPLHAAQVARDLGMPRILVPESPGLLCAMGLLLANVRADFSRTRVIPAFDADLRLVNEILADLAERAAHWLGREGVPSDMAVLEWRLDMRYVGQDYHLSIPSSAGPIGADDVTALVERFHEAHEQAYGYRSAGAPVEIVNYRVTATSLTPKPAFRHSRSTRTDASSAIVTERKVFFEEAGGFVTCPIYDRRQLGSGHRFSGPAVITQMDSTVVILPGQDVCVDEYRNLHISN